IISFGASGPIFMLFKVQGSKFKSSNVPVFQCSKAQALQAVSLAKAWRRAQGSEPFSYPVFSEEVSQCIGSAEDCHHRNEPSQRKDGHAAQCRTACASPPKLGSEAEQYAA